MKTKNVSYRRDKLGKSLFLLKTWYYAKKEANGESVLNEVTLFECGVCVSTVISKTFTGISSELLNDKFMKFVYQNHEVGNF